MFPAKGKPTSSYYSNNLVYIRVIKQILDFLLFIWIVIGLKEMNVCQKLLCIKLIDQKILDLVTQGTIDKLIVKAC